MSHTTIYFLTEAESLGEAENKVTTHLETEHFYDYSDVIHELSGQLAVKRHELLEFAKNWDWKKNADNFLVEAEEQRASGNMELYGYYLIKAGELYAQHLTVDTYAFNINLSDYTIPDEDKNWWAIAMDIHY
jgi:hypothetical protein